MSKISRRSLLFLGRDRDPDPEPEPEPPRPAPSDEGLAWQRQQGSRAEGGALPPVISWLADYIDEEPALPRASLAPLLRPPGAVAEARFLELCNRCGDCASACPHAAIATAPPVYRAASGTPRIDPSVAPCRLCEDLPCIGACETGALRDDGARMGTARINRFDCINALGTSCSICAEQCPVDQAIDSSGPIPAVRQDLCVGCGLCHHVCPAPRNAVAILPNSERLP